MISELKKTALGCASAIAFSLALAPCSATAQTSAAAEQELLHSVAAEVDPESLRAYLTAMVGFGTRHTLSDTVSETRGIGAARRWVEQEFRKIGAECGGCFEIALPAETVTGPRIPNPTELVNVLAIQRGSGDPNRVILISGHLDSRVTDILNATDDAPGANDDGSGVAAVMEAARILSKHKFDATLVYAALVGEEQGLVGARIVADYARAQGWVIEANLNNDVVGNSLSQTGQRDSTRIRVFSEGTKIVETPEQGAYRRSVGGELDSPSRNLARYIDSIADRYLMNFDVDLIYRPDRYGRGGDQTEMLRAGFPAVRITEGAEHYDRQHQDLRTENGIEYGDTLEAVDFDYLAQATRLNVAAMASLANAPMPPADVTLGRPPRDTPRTVWNGTGVRLTWSPAAGATGYRVWWRSTTAVQWTNSREAGSATELLIPGISIDDYNFGVSSISEDGYESPVAFPGQPGAFISAPNPAAPNR